jgi:hypothetical protein
MTERYPDIEIYLMKAEPSAVKAWLKSVFGELQERSAQLWQVQYQGQSMELFFDPKAEKNFASLWFKQNHTPWLTDLDCARAAHLALGVEVRCQASGWAEEEGETDAGWVKLLRGEEKPFTWF